MKTCEASPPLPSSLSSTCFNNLLKKFSVDTTWTSTKVMLNTLLLWMLSATFSAGRFDFNTSITGTFVTYNILDVIFIYWNLAMLYKGLMVNILLVMPWLLLSMFGLYGNHYVSIRRAFRILNHTRHPPGLGRIALYVASIVLFLRMILLLRILYFLIKLWRKKRNLRNIAKVKMITVNSQKCKEK